uniref:beta-2-glycoprotein 1-like n=1 Tax=Pristiophorus japonicus TaxID=55135 RepID=UPI00398E76D3
MCPQWSKRGAAHHVVDEDQLSDGPDTQPDEEVNGLYSFLSKSQPIVVKLNSVPVSMEWVTGASQSTFDKLWDTKAAKPKLSPVNVRLGTFTKELILVLSSAAIEVSYHSVVHELPLWIIPACGKPPNVNNANVVNGKKVYEPGEEVMYSCMSGYAGFGLNRLICPKSGVWGQPKIKCAPKSCHVPYMLENGEMQATDFKFGREVYYKCNEGFKLKGLNRSTCLSDGTWSDQQRSCEPIQCSPPTPPKNGKIRLHPTGRPNKVSVFGDMIFYECMEGLALIGNETGFCLANGNWTNSPQCKEVKCVPPPKIVNGFLVFALKRSYNFKESVEFGCIENYILDGSRAITCEKTGNWTPKPMCRAPCILPVKRARIFYNGKKLWIDDLSKKRILHAERVAFYCKNKERNCGYPVLAQCIDSKVQLPSCFEEPSKISYNLYYRSLPSEIAQC